MWLREHLERSTGNGDEIPLFDTFLEASVLCEALTYICFRRRKVACGFLAFVRVSFIYCQNTPRVLPLYPLGEGFRRREKGKAKEDGEGGIPAYVLRLRGDLCEFDQEWRYLMKPGVPRVARDINTSR